VSDIPANLEVGLAKARYFKCGDADDLKKKMAQHLATPITSAEKAAFRRLIQEKYNWQKIAEQTIQVYQAL
jgi:glycosyltransferase involved in cell wall biosynthesis